MPLISIDTAKKQANPSQIAGEPWEVIDNDLFTANDSNIPCVLDYHSKYPVVREAEKLSPEFNYMP